ncbi:hypothetical protein GQ600_23137 [Phytophthora cactorum]|nr:hypothetical protein GQ600_23137 [Phytophthora cactorum]
MPYSEALITTTVLSGERTCSLHVSRRGRTRLCCNYSPKTRWPWRSCTTRANTNCIIERLLRNINDRFLLDSNSPEPYIAPSTVAYTVALHTIAQTKRRERLVRCDAIALFQFILALAYWHATCTFMCFILHSSCPASLNLTTTCDWTSQAWDAVTPETIRNWKHSVGELLNPWEEKILVEDPTDEDYCCVDTNSENEIRSELSSAEGTTKMQLVPRKRLIISLPSSCSNGKRSDCTIGLVHSGL